MQDTMDGIWSLARIFPLLEAGVSPQPTGRPAHVSRGACTSRSVLLSLSEEFFGCSWKVELLEPGGPAQSFAIVMFFV